MVSPQEEEGVHAQVDRPAEGDHVQRAAFNRLLPFLLVIWNGLDTTGQEHPHHSAFFFPVATHTLNVYLDGGISLLCSLSTFFLCLDPENLGQTERPF